MRQALSLATAFMLAGCLSPQEMAHREQQRLAVASAKITAKVESTCDMKWTKPFGGIKPSEPGYYTEFVRFSCITPNGESVVMLFDGAGNLVSATTVR